MINELCPMRWRIQIAAFAAVVAVNYAPAFGQDIQYREDPNAEKRMTLLNVEKIFAMYHRGKR
jgi:hypothetical protein